MSLLILSLVHLIRAGEGAPALMGLRWGESPGSRVSVPGKEPRLSCVCTGERAPVLEVVSTFAPER